MVWAPDYVTLEEVREFLDIPAGDTADDAILAVFITDASRAIDAHTGRQFGNTGTAQVRYFRARWRADVGRWVAVIDDLQVEPTGVDIDGAAATGYRFGPRNAVAKGLPYERLELAYGSAVVPASPDWEIAVTAVWGWSAVPAAVAAACWLQVSRFYSRRQSPYGVAGSPELGSELRLLSKLDADVAVSLAGYVRLAAPG